MKLVDLTGGARVGYKNASWPFARLTASKKELRLRVKLIGKYSFRPQDIEKLEVIKVLPLLGQGIRIHHNKETYPSKIIFWSLSDPNQVLKAIEQAGILNRSVSN